MKKNVIITSANKNHGKFLIKHWFKSLIVHVNLCDTDVVVIDYGLTKEQTERLIENHVVLYRGNRVNHITTQRFIDAGKFLKKNPYEKVLFCDGGDLIFQEDISHLFNLNGEFLCVATEEEILLNERYIPLFFKKKYQKKVYHYLKDRVHLNAGLFIAPRNRFINLANQMVTLIKNKKNYGPDQVAFNYAVHQQGFKLLDKKYNFLLDTVKEGFTLRDGNYYLKNGEKIAVVHNSGWIGVNRPIIGFGYRKAINLLNFPIYYFRKLYYKFLSLLKSILSKILYN